MASLEDERRIFERLFSSDVKADVLFLFNENPMLIDRTQGVARRIGRTSGQIDNDLKDLIDIGVLFKKKVGGAENICFDRKRAAEIRNLISTYVQKTLEPD